MDWGWCAEVMEVGAEKLGSRGPLGGGEVHPPVRFDLTGGAKVSYPFLRETAGTCVCGGGREGNGFWPEGGPVHAGEEMGETSGGGQRPNNV